MGKGKGRAILLRRASDAVIEIRWTEWKSIVCRNTDPLLFLT